MRSKFVEYITITLVILGALNWGLVGFFNFNLVTALFGNSTLITRGIYAIISIAGVYSLTLYSKLNLLENLDKRYSKVD